MKKFLACMLAAAMVASMSAVSFAASTTKPSGMAHEMTGKEDKTSPQKVYEDMFKNGKYDKEDGYPLDTTLIGPFGYDNEDKYLTIDSVEFGKTAYFLLTNLEPADPNDLASNNTVSRLVTDSDTVSGVSIKTDWEEGEDLAKEITVVKRKVQNVGWYKYIDADTSAEFKEDSKTQEEADGVQNPKEGALELLEEYGFQKDENKYYYMLAINVGDSTSTSDADIIGTLTIKKSKKPKADSHEYDVSINVDWENSFRKDNSEVNLDGVNEDIGPLKAETYYSAKFDGDEEIEISFEDESTFTVDISGQSKLLLYYDTEHSSKIAAKNPLAELNFWNGNGAKFNRTGEFFLRVGDDAEDYAQYLYQVNADGTLSEVAGAEYDEGDGGFYFKTRTLGTYVYSDMELETSSSNAGNASDKDDNVVTPPVAPVTPVAPVNPGTGARA